MPRYIRGPSIDTLCSFFRSPSNKTILKENGLALKALPDLQDKEEYCRIAVKSSPAALQFVSPRLQNSYDFVLSIVKVNGGALEFASDELKNNFDIVLAAVHNSCMAIIFASDGLQRNPEIFREAYLNGFQLFISTNYVEYLRSIGDDRNADWITDLCNDLNCIYFLLAAENSGDAQRSLG